MKEDGWHEVGKYYIHIQHTIHSLIYNKTDSPATQGKGKGKGKGKGIYRTDGEEGTWTMGRWTSDDETEREEDAWRGGRGGGGGGTTPMSKQGRSKHW